MYVFSLNEETGSIEPHRINALLDMGVKPVFKLTTASGRHIRTTGNHPYLVKGEGSRLKGEEKSAVERLGFEIEGEIIAENSSIENAKWIRVAGLFVGDEIAVPNKDSLNGVFQSADSLFNNCRGNKEATTLIEKVKGFFGFFKREPVTSEGIGNNSYAAMDFKRELSSSNPGRQIVGKKDAGLYSQSRMNTINFCRLQASIFNNNIFASQGLPDASHNFYIRPLLNGFEAAVRSTLSDFCGNASRNNEKWESLKEFQLLDLVQMDKWTSIYYEFIHSSVPRQYLSGLSYVALQPILPPQVLPTELPYAGIYVSSGIASAQNPHTILTYQSLLPLQLPLAVSHGAILPVLPIAQLLPLAYLPPLSSLTQYNTGNSGLSNDFSDVIWDKVVSIDFVGYEQVYDIEVEGTHNFIAGHWIEKKAKSWELRAGSNNRDLVVLGFGIFHT